MQQLSSYFPMEEITSTLQEEFRAFLLGFDEEVSKEKFILTKAKLAKGDFTVMMKGVLAKLKRKVNVDEYTTNLVSNLNDYLATKPESLIKSAKAEAGFINFYVNRSGIMKESIRHVLKLGERYGKSDVKKGCSVIVEHTSTNPNGPLHIGNLRNTMLGSHLSQILSAVGYNVKQHFYVNDLGAQVGYTAFGYLLVFDKMEPKMKIDQWIGFIYALMNTLVELQKTGVSIAEYRKSLEEKVMIEVTRKEEETEEVFTSRKANTDLITNLYSRQPELSNLVLRETENIPSIKAASAAWNLRYENNDPEAVRLFRAMVINCLSGVQETFDIYNVKHDSYDFESELGWEGSNERVLDILRASPYFTPQTSSNSKGVPEGGYLCLDRYIYDAKLPTGKKGYMDNYPNFYLLREDGSTLYTFRDVVYSLKKCGLVDQIANNENNNNNNNNDDDNAASSSNNNNNQNLVFNIICAEQNLPQEKVALSMRLLDPLAPRKQYHISYELVKLTQGKMSGRRATYVLADDVYEEMKEQVKHVMLEKRKADSGKAAFHFKDEVLEQNTLDITSAEVASSAMKFALLATPPRHEIKFDIAKAADPESASNAPFILYNATRLISLFRKYEEGVEKGSYPALRPIDEVDFSCLAQAEWALLSDYILVFPSLVLSLACPAYPPAPQLPSFDLNKICDFCLTLANEFSSYYNNHKVLVIDDEASVNLMMARLYLCQAVLTLFKNALGLLTIKVVERM